MHLSNPPLAPIRIGLFALGLMPLAWLVLSALHGAPNNDPVEVLQRWTGTWAINFLWLTLCITPLRTLTEWHWLIRLRRTLGLFSFFYALLHVLCYAGLAHEFVAQAIARDIFKQPFVIAGFAALLLMLPLAATSSNAAIRKLGGRRWQSLHRAIYPAAIFVAIHYLWQTDVEEMLWPLGYTLTLVALLGWRARAHKRKAIPVPIGNQPSPLRFHAKRPD